MVRRNMALADGRRVRLEGEGGELASWQVSLDGEEIGEVRRFVTYLNLRRPVTIRGWRAFPRRDLGLPFRLPEGQDQCFTSQRVAVAALVAAVEAVGR